MKNNLWKVFEGIVDRSHDERENTRTADQVSNYAEFGCNINLSTEEAGFIAKKVCEYFDTDWHGTNDLFHLFEKPLKNFN